MAVMAETDPESTSGEPTPQVPDDREDTGGAETPADIDTEGPQPHVPDDRKGAAGFDAWSKEGSDPEAE